MPCGFSCRGYAGVARQTSAQRHGGDGYEGSAEPHHEQQQAPVPSCSHRGLPTGQPGEHQDAERAQLQGWGKGVLHAHKNSVFTQCRHKPQKQIIKFSIQMNQQPLLIIDMFGLFVFIDCHTKGIWDGVGQIRPLQWTCCGPGWRH